MEVVADPGQPLSLVALQGDTEHYSRLIEYLPKKFGCNTQNISFQLREIIPSGPKAIIAEHKQELVFLADADANKVFTSLINSPHLFRYIFRVFICSHVSDNLRFLQGLSNYPEKIYRVQVFPNAKLKHITEALPSGLKLHPKQFTDILSVICANGRYYYGLADKELYYNQEQIYKPENKISRAYYKMQEIIERVECLPIQKDWKVIDVGASPGGWTQCLSPLVAEVVSIDPAELRIEIPKNVTYHKMKSQDYPVYLRKQYNLSEEQNLPLIFDCATSDINETPQTVLGYLSPILPLVKPNGYLVMTLKYPRRREDNLMGKLEEFQAEFRERFPEWEVITSIWLLANFNERTIVATKRGSQ